MRAFAVRDGRFVHAGSVEDAMALCGPSTEVVDARGLTVLPGLIDAHLHLTNLGLKLRQVNLDGVESPEALVDRVGAFARTSNDEWILGRGWDENCWPLQEFPSHHALSAAIPDRPVVLARVDGHAILANARALALAGVTATTSDPPGGRIVRDARGEPTGILIDNAEAFVYDRAPKPTHGQLVRAVRDAVAECNRWGITAVCEPGCGDEELAAQKALLESGDFSLRNYAMLHDEPSLIERHARAGIVEGAYGGRLWVRAIKLYSDGALGSRGAALLAPYSDDPQNSGLILTPRERIERVTENALRTGFQTCVHAIGDRANRMVLDAFESVLHRAGASQDPRLRIEHAQVIASEDIPRFAALGVIASVQTTHAVSDGPWVRARLGPDRIARAYPWRALLDAGTAIANGTDAPVEPANPARSFLAGIARNGADPSECMTRREAFASMTLGAAHAAFAENDIGSIAPGKYADFVLLDCDWMSATPEEIERTKVVATYFGGKRVY
ncbi:MAG: amidohydrolase [Candidatus Eremiobacteraeota bacterium]|nr:amidohydrolase [Candidatus Eremiobacteraeota bacterium]